MTTFAPENISFLALPWKRLQDRQQLPDCAAIYFVCDVQSKVLYIGRTTSLVTRWLAHNRMGQARTVDGCRIAWLVVTDPALLPGLEEACIEYFCPPWNGHPTEITSTKITSEALALLKQIAAQTGEKQYATLTRLLTREWERLQRARRQKEMDHVS